MIQKNLKLEFVRAITNYRKGCEVGSHEWRLKKKKKRNNQMIFGVLKLRRYFDGEGSATPRGITPAPLNAIFSYSID